MSTPNQMFTHELNGIKVFYPGQPWVCDKAADVDTGVTGYSTNLIAGRAAYLNTSGKWVAGYTASQTNTYTPVPFLIFQNVSDFDVVGDDGNFVGAASSGTQTPRLSGVACTQAMEVETTEFVGTFTVADSGKPLSITTGTGATAGKIKVRSAGEAICGVISDGGVTSPHSSSITLLRFHTCFLPVIS